MKISHKFCLAKQVLIFWGMKMGNFCYQDLKLLGSYPGVLTCGFLLYPQPFKQE